MLTKQVNNARTAAFGHDFQTLHYQYHVIQAECPVLRNHYQNLYEHYRALLERYPTRQGYDPGVVTFRQELDDYRQSLQELRQLIQHFRHTLQAHRVNIESYRGMQNGGLQAVRPLLRANILLGVPQERDAAFLKESIQQAGTYRVFVVNDWSEVACLLQSVQINLLVLDDDLIPLAGIERYEQVQSIKRAEGLPTIIIGDSCSLLYQPEQTPSNLKRLEKPIEVNALVKAIDQLLL